MKSVYSWDIPERVRIGEKYKIRIESSVISVGEYKLEGETIKPKILPQRYYYDESDNYFSIIDRVFPTPTVTILPTPLVEKISPSSGSVGTKVTIVGSGFTSTGNDIKFGQGYIQNLSSEDGVILRFTVPSGLGVCSSTTEVCIEILLLITPGIYDVSVINKYGESNKIKFEVTKEENVTVLSPNGGESWSIRTKQEIRWRAPSSTSIVNIYLQNWVPPCEGRICPLMMMPIFNYPIAKNAENDGEFTWIVGKDYVDSNIPEGSYVVIVEDSQNPNNFDKSDYYFKIVQASTNRPPVITEVSGPTAIEVNKTGTWTVRAYDPDGTWLLYNIDWGDNTIVPLPMERMFLSPGITQQASFTHVYTSSGNYKIVFTVKDKYGAEAQSSITADVSGMIITATPLATFTPSVIHTQ